MKTTKAFLSIIIIMLMLIPTTVFAGSLSADAIKSTVVSEAMQLSGLKQVKSTRGNVEVVDNIIQITEYVSDYVEVTMIEPLTLTESGLVNTFEYTAMPQVQLENINEFNENFTDMTVTHKVYYAEYFDWNTFATFYRHSAVESKWDSYNSTCSVSNLYVMYDSRGELYSYPNYQPVSNDYHIISTISRSYPSKNTWFISYEPPMPLDRVLYFSDYFTHGGNVYTQMQYSVNGNSYNHYRSSQVYGK